MQPHTKKLYQLLKLKVVNVSSMCMSGACSVDLVGLHVMHLNIAQGVERHPRCVTPLRFMSAF